jgi:hypothetical protein
MTGSSTGSNKAGGSPASATHPTGAPSSSGADGGRLKLEWEVLEARTGARVEDLLWWDHGHLCGFLGLYSGSWWSWPEWSLRALADAA